MPGYSLNNQHKKVHFLLKIVMFLIASGFVIADQDVSPTDLELRIDAYVTPYVQSNNFSGTILIAQGGRVLVRKGYGMANFELTVPNMPETVFHVASISKSFTAAAVILLEQGGLLKISDPLTKFIPDYPHGEEITIHHLLVHTSGIPNINSFPDYDDKSLYTHNLDDIISWFKHKPLEMKPGERYRYSNSNYNLLAKIIEIVAGQSYGEYLQKNIFEPLRMEDTAHDDDPSALIPCRAHGYMPARAQDLENAPPLVWSIKTGNGSIYTTVDDLFKWDRALYGDKLLNQASRQKIFTDYGHGVGYGWFIRKDKSHHYAINGRAPGFSSSLERFVDDDVCIIITSNLYSSITHTMAADLNAIVFGEERLSLIPVTPMKIDPSILESYVGRYQFGDDYPYNPRGVAAVEKEGDLLGLTSGGGRTSYLIPLSMDHFIDRLYGGTVSFVKDTEGKITYLIWNFGEDYKAERLKDIFPSLTCLN